MPLNEDNFLILILGQNGDILRTHTEAVLFLEDRPLPKNISTIFGSDKVWADLSFFEYPITVVNGSASYKVTARKANTDTAQWEVSITSVENYTKDLIPWYKDPLAGDLLQSNNIFWAEINLEKQIVNLSENLCNHTAYDKKLVTFHEFLANIEGIDDDDMVALLGGDDIEIELEGRIICALQEKKWFRISLKPFVYRDGKLSEAVLFLKDINLKRIEELELLGSNNLVKSVSDAMPDTIIIYNPFEEVIAYSSIRRGRGEHIGVFQKGQTVNGLMPYLYPDDRDQFVETMQDCIASDNPRRTYSVEFRIGSEEFGWKWHKIRFKLLIRPSIDNSVEIRLLGIISDINEEKIKERQLLEQGMLLDETQMSSQTGGWKYSLETHQVQSTYGLRLLFPKLKATDSTLESFASGIDPKFVDDLKAFVFSSANEILNDYEIQLLSDTNEEEVRWFRSKIKRVHGPQGVAKYVIGSFQDITTLKLQEHQLLENKKQLEQQVEIKSNSLISMYKEKNEMLRTARHDINNPLTAVFLRLEILEDMFEANGEKVYLEKLSEIFIAARRIEEILSKFTDSGNNVWDDYQLSIDKVNVFTLVNSQISSKMAESRKKGILINCSQSDCIIQTDRFLLGQILENIISNGIKYCSPGDRIDIDIKYNSDYCYISVSDSGPGIPQSELPKLFTDNTKYTNKPTGGEKSNGVGLYFSQKYASLIDSTIEVDSKVGVGSTFKIIVPIANGIKLITY